MSKLLEWSKVVIFGYTSKNDAFFGIIRKKKPSIIAKGVFYFEQEVVSFTEFERDVNSILLIDQALQEQDWNCYSPKSKFYKSLMKAKEEVEKAQYIGDMPISLFISCFM